MNEELNLIKLSAEDRCDRCAAQAYYMATHEDHASELLFCGHHIKEYGPALLGEGWTVIQDYESWEDQVSPAKAGV